MTDYPFDLGAYSRKITTSSEDAQIWFNRGLNWNYGYNHEEAAVCFKKALEFDPDCAMAYWGIAYMAGPNYNRWWELFTEKELDHLLTETRWATGAARERMGNASDVEQALISALEYRYQSETPVEDLYAWSDSYADAMRDVLKRFPDDREVIALTAEAMMNRTPWQMWDPRTGEPCEGADTLECREILETGIAKVRAAGERPHPGIWHLYIHLMEMSPTPEVALKIGDEVRRLMPDSGHLVHMPTHIDVQAGDYQATVDWNHLGIDRDVKYWKMAGALNFYSMYRVHNYHFKAYGAMLLGQYEPALEAIQTMHETIPDELVRQQDPPMADWLEAFMSIGSHVFVRFGRWQDAIDDPLPHDQKLYCVTTAMNYYGKGVAYAALKQDDKAKEAQQLFEKTRAAVPETRHLHVTDAHPILEVASEVLAGEIAYHRGDYDEAFAHLRKGVELEDNLPYDEPWPWMMPSRHALGALLLEQGHAEEASQVYEADLGISDECFRAQQHPNNVWALTGAHECYTRLGRHKEARMIKPALDIALARADDSIRTSCFCAVTTGLATAGGQSSCCHAE